MAAIFFALASYVGWASSDVFSALSSRKTGTFLAAFWTDFIGFILLSLFVPFFLQDLKKFNLEIFFVTLVLSVILWIAWPIFLEAMRIGNSSIVGTIAGSFGGLVVILSTFFLHENILPIQLIGIITILAGIVLSSLNFSDLKNKKFIENKGTIFAIITMIIWGIYFTFVRIPVDQVGWFWPAYIALATGTVIMISLAIIRRKNVRKIPSKQYLNLSLSSISATAGTVSYNFAITQGLTAIVAPIATSYPTLFVLLSRFVFKEKLTKQQWIGIVVGLIGIVILALVS